MQLLQGRGADSVNPLERCVVSGEDVRYNCHPCQYENVAQAQGQPGGLQRLARTTTDPVVIGGRRVGSGQIDVNAPNEAVGFVLAADIHLFE